MIAEIETTREYGRDGQACISLLPDMTELVDVVFAHSIEDAIEWLAQLPLYQDAIVDRMPANGAAIVTSQWMPYEGDMMDVFFGDENPHKGAKYIRDQAVIKARNTIYENVGYARYQSEQ